MMLKKINWSAVLILLVATVSAQDDSIGCYVPGACMRSLYVSAMSTDDIGECVTFCKVNSDLLCKRIFTYMQYRLFKILLSVSVHMVFIYAVPLSCTWEFCFSSGNRELQLLQFLPRWRDLRCPWEMRGTHTGLLPGVHLRRCSMQNIWRLNICFWRLAHDVLRLNKWRRVCETLHPYCKNSPSRLYSCLKL